MAVAAVPVTPPAAQQDALAGRFAAIGSRIANLEASFRSRDDAVASSLPASPAHNALQRRYAAVDSRLSVAERALGIAHEAGTAAVLTTGGTLIGSSTQVSMVL